MSAFQRAVGDTVRPAPRTILLSVDEFAEQWVNRPTSSVAIGIRVPSERDYRTADIEAAKLATTEEYNRKALDIIVSRGICDPNDVCSPHPLFPLAEDVVPLALKPRGIQRIYDEIERLSIDQSPVYEEATPAELADLWSYLSMDEPFEGMDDVKAALCRRYLKFALEHFQEADVERQAAEE